MLPSTTLITVNVAEGALLFVAAQTGFIDGPRILANMAIDSWVPHRFAQLSDRLVTKNGVFLMGGGAVAVLLYSRGQSELLVLMYSINVFLTFSLSEFGMSRFWIQHRKEHPDWYRHLPIHLTGLTLCLTILIVTCFEKFAEGGWLTLVITGALVLVCFWIKRHYNRVVTAIRRLDVELADPLPQASTFPKPSVATLAAAASRRVVRASSWRRVSVSVSGCGQAARASLRAASSAVAVQRGRQAIPAPWRTISFTVADSCNSIATSKRVTPMPASALSTSAL